MPVAGRVGETGNRVAQPLVAGPAKGGDPALARLQRDRGSCRRRPPCGLGGRVAGAIVAELGDQPSPRQIDGLRVLKQRQEDLARRDGRAPPRRSGQVSSADLRRRSAAAPPPGRAPRRVVPARSDVARASLRGRRAAAPAARRALRRPRVARCGPGRQPGASAPRPRGVRRASGSAPGRRARSESRSRRRSAPRQAKRPPAALAAGWRARPAPRPGPRGLRVRARSALVSSESGASARKRWASVRASSAKHEGVEAVGLAVGDRIARRALPSAWLGWIAKTVEAGSEQALDQQPVGSLDRHPPRRRDLACTRSDPRSQPRHG